MFKEISIIFFKQIGWDNWIIAPPSFELNFCSGECKFPFHDSMNTTNHAIIHGIVRSTNVDVPGPCCVPTELASIDMLIANEYDNAILNTYPGMKIKSCGCR